jgi:GT2 family glycosyltransferase
VQPDLSISIINTNNREVTLNCLRAVFANTARASLEVFVVDNASTDGSAEAIGAEFSQVTLIRNETRLGFSTNNNLALARALGRHLMLLNDDTLVQPGALDLLVEFLDAHPDVGAVGGYLLNPDMTFQGGYDYELDPVHEALRPLSDWIGRRCVREQAGPTQVDWVSGACMAVRREVVQQVGLLDTAFDPLYTEETDWCFRIRQAGWCIALLPEARVVHLGSQTMNRAPLARVELLRRHQALYFRKHRGPVAAWLFKVLLLLSSVAKLSFWSVCWTLGRCDAGARVRSHWHTTKLALTV